VQLRFFLDECLSHRLVDELTVQGHYVIHPVRHGGVGQKDHTVLQRCLADNLIIVTENGIDFRKLVGQQELHPGLIVLPNLPLHHARRLIALAVRQVQAMRANGQSMMNQIMEVTQAGDVSIREIPPLA